MSFLGANGAWAQASDMLSPSTVNSWFSTLPPAAHGDIDTTPLNTIDRLTAGKTAYFNFYVDAAGDQFYINQNGTRVVCDLSSGGANDCVPKAIFVDAPRVTVCINWDLLTTDPPYGAGKPFAGSSTATNWRIRAGVCSDETCVGKTTRPIMAKADSALHACSTTLIKHNQGLFDGTDYAADGTHIKGWLYMFPFHSSSGAMTDFIQDMTINIRLVGQHSDRGE